jgi:hypothetical protein
MDEHASADELKERIFRHLDTATDRTLRTESGVAAALDLDLPTAIAAMLRLEREFRIWPEPRIDYLLTWAPRRQS